MKPTFHPIHMKFYTALLLLVVAYSTACHRQFHEALEEVAEKTVPHEMFALQRSYPDRSFDWQGWQKAMRQARAARKVQQRDNSCSGTLADWTLQGPANIAGRVNSLIVKANEQQTMLAGFSAGGIFKTNDGGANWRPVFDEFSELSIGHLTFDPSNSNIVYAGTGDSNIPSYVFNGEGVFKSTDAGETWQAIGLTQVGIISKIVVHPTQPQTLFVSAMGNPYVRNNDRGVYKTTDGGQTWQQVLFVSNQAGASDLVIDPLNPQVLYASFWDRIRNNSESIVYGPHARVYKSTDGGANWTMLGGGLPTYNLGRTGLAISRQNPQKLYVLYVDSLSRVGAIYQTLDGGNTWNPFSISGLQSAYANFGWYFGKLILHPDNDNEIYLPGVQLWRKTAASNNWVNIGGGHSDIHDLAFLSSGKRYAANDGGVYYQNVGSTGWTRCLNLPLTQFYHTNYNKHRPDMYIGGAQDNGTSMGNAQAINNWQEVFGSDGFRASFHPSDPNIFWVSSQGGALHKTIDGGANWQVGQNCLGTSDRCNWDTPYFLSQHNPEQVYAGTYRVYLNNQGLWAAASGDLTDGNILGDAFHTISALDESPLSAGKLFAGTSDANVWRREPAGAWVNISAGLPNRYVTSVQGSPTLAQRIFVTQSGFRDDDYIPHIHRSDNNGQTWVDISGELPPLPVSDLLVLPGNADSLLFAATDAGVYFSKNAGAEWNRLGNNIPFVPVFDLDYNVIRNQLVAATYARGIWTFPLDSLLIPAPGVQISLTGNMGAAGSISTTPVTQNIQADASGAFQFSPVEGCQDYTLTPYRNDNPTNGVTTFDLVLISKHILGLEPLNTPYKIIAADANRSGAVTTFDIVQLRKLILGIDTVFSGNTSWRFVPSDYIFANPQNPFSSAFPESLNIQAGSTSVSALDFEAIKVGDVNETAAPGFQSGLEERKSPQPLLFENRAFEAQEFISCVFSADVKNMAGWQFTLRFDQNVLQLEQVVPLEEGLAAEHMSTEGSEQGLLTFSFDLGGKLLGEGPEDLFELRFKALKKGSLLAAIQISDMPTQACFFQLDGTAYKPVLLSKPERAADFVAPNPFGKDGCWLFFGQQNASPFELQIVDSQGKITFQQDLPENPPLFLSAETFPVPGAYLYRITDKKTGKVASSGRLIYAP